ncbi:myosin tail-domain-containing protein [Ostreococcus tauri]|uniref:Myosin tail-domain-containing protein n=1 Tax=Ostreococcus tauri TaxID=70448 RepID=A0A1Y5HY90_OSTTA|nr:myosin tail-domain-containing protein [Ostreococcus tauri]
MSIDHPSDSVLRPFLGVKERRRSSFAKRALGDDLGVAKDAHFAKALSKHGVTEVVFSARALKLNHRDELKHRILVVSDVGVVLLDEISKRVRRKFAWKDVSEVRLSVHADDFFALIAPDEYDVLLACNRKTEAIVAMRKMWKRDVTRRGGMDARGGGGETELRVTASEQFTYMASALRERRVEFTRVDGGDVDIDVVDVDDARDEDERGDDDRARLRRPSDDIV